MVVLEFAPALERDGRLLGGRLDRFGPLPDGPGAAFVNEATIPFQHESGDVGRLAAYYDRAECAVLNTFVSDEPGTDDPVSRREKVTLARLHAWADRSIALPSADRTEAGPPTERRHPNGSSQSGRGPSTRPRRVH